MNLLDIFTMFYLFGVNLKPGRIIGGNKQLDLLFKLKKIFLME